ELLDLALDAVNRHVDGRVHVVAGALAADKQGPDFKGNLSRMTASLDAQHHRRHHGPPAVVKELEQLVDLALRMAAQGRRHLDIFARYCDLYGSCVLHSPHSSPLGAPGHGERLLSP